MQSLEARLYAALRDGGMAEVPDRFSVAPLHQVVPAMTLADIDHFVRVFDRVTTRRSWQEAATASAPEVAGRRRQEVCFFSAWDFHIPDDRPDDWQLIEFNDNGSGFLFAALLNRVFYQVSPAWTSAIPSSPRPISPASLAELPRWSRTRRHSGLEGFHTVCS
jgi:hypothetical protein